MHFLFQYSQNIELGARSGFVNPSLGGIPVTWWYKLYTEIALSTLESEYIALSTGMRKLIGGKILIKELKNSNDISTKDISIISKVWEVNEGALKHAVSSIPKLSPRTKHIRVKYR